MAFTRITEDDLQGKGVIGQPEVPGLSTLEMQQSMEQVVREVAIPGINRLAEELEAATGAAGIGMERPAGMPEEVPAHVQGITAAHIENRENPHGVTAAQVGAYTRQETDAAIDNKVVEIGAGDMARAVYAANGEPGVVDAAVHARAADDGVKLYTHTRSGTVHEFTGSGASGRALMTADVQEGDTFSVNGQPVTAWMGAEDAATMMAGQPYTGRWVTFVTEDDTLNFKGGGGLTAADKIRLIPENIRYGVQIGKVLGTLGANLIVAGDTLVRQAVANNSPQASATANSAWQEIQRDDAFSIDGANIVCKKAGSYQYEMRVITGSVWNGSALAYLRLNGSNVISGGGSGSGIKTNTYSGMLELSEGDILTVYLYVLAGTGQWSGNGEVSVGYLKLSRKV